jgi:tetratricopeptide (TPR) repeat protein
MNSDCRYHYIPFLGGILLAVSLAAGSSAMAQQHQHMHDEATVHEGQEIGTVDFQASCNAAAQDDFNRALGLMHHMMYVQARKQFEAITEADADCGMAWWGVATTLFQPIWGTRPSEEELQRGWRNIERASELVPEEGRERLLVDATRGFFREPGEAEFRTRIDRWTDGMKAAYEAHPEDADVAALYALSRLTIAQQQATRRDALHDEAEKVLREIWEEKPRHPGAIHYSIHATDADGRAENALDMVEVYAQIAPEVPHALHMPSHIYVRLGEWDDVIEWNRRSADAALKTGPVDGGVSHHYIHALDYMMYAYLQQGEDDKARAVYEEAMEQDRHQASFVAAYHLAAMPAREAVEQRDWQAAAGIEPRTPEYLPWDASRWPEGISWHARGLGAVHTGDLEQAREAEQRLAALRDEAREDDEENFATYIEVDRLILAGWLARADGENEEGVRLMRKAADLERTVEKHPVTPGALLPPNEALGDLLMDLDRPDEAVQAYLASDKIWPGRFNTLLGGARAAQAAGDEQQARELYSQLLEVAGNSERVEISEAEQLREG